MSIPYKNRMGTGGRVVGAGMKTGKCSGKCADEKHKFKGDDSFAI